MTALDSPSFVFTYDNVKLLPTKKKKKAFGETHASLTAVSLSVPLLFYGIKMSVQTPAQDRKVHVNSRMQTLTLILLNMCVWISGLRVLTPNMYI